MRVCRKVTKVSAQGSAGAACRKRRTRSINREGTAKMTKESEDLEREKETLRERAMMRVYYAAKEGFCTQLLALLSEIKDEEERRAIVNQVSAP